MHYTIALDERPGYAYALAGLARMAVAGKCYSKAIEYYRKAASMVNDYSINEEWQRPINLPGKKKVPDSLTACYPMNSAGMNEQPE